MIRSMTGFGRAEKSAAGWRCWAELRSVNGRFLEVRFKLPPGLLYLEEKLKALIRADCERGKIDCTLTLAPENPAQAEMAWNKELLQQYAGLLKNFQQVLGTEIQVTLGNLTTIKELFPGERWEDHAEGLEPLLCETVRAGVEELVRMRAREGDALHAEMVARIATIGELMDTVSPLAGKVPDNYARRLRENLSQLMDGIPPREERILQEIALLADRCDVSEEISRFNTHLDHLAQMLRQGGAVGRKFDFLLQELNREANTLASKSNDAEISGCVVEIKSELEKLREQIQNIE
ncbi:MAG: YicC/YloC family endoribonuclease [bacterium]